MSIYTELAGKTFNRLTFICQSPAFTSTNRLWTARCSCGKIKDVNVPHVIGGRIQSCGCLRLETVKAARGIQLAKRSRYSGNAAFRLDIDAKQVIPNNNRKRKASITPVNIDWSIY